MERKVQPTSGAIKAANRASIVDALRRGGAATRAQLMDATGLSRATISTLLGEMRAQGLISEQRPAVANGFGRPPSAIVLNRSAGLAIGVDVGVRHVAVAVGDLSHRVLAERWVALPHGHSARHGVRAVLRSIEETLSEAEADPGQLVGAAISIAAPISPDTGQMMNRDRVKHPLWRVQELLAHATIEMTMRYGTFRRTCPRRRCGCSMGVATAWQRPAAGGRKLPSS